jgi:hypothetical protein
MEQRPKFGGRKKGVQNKVTREFKETVLEMLRENADNVPIWLAKVAEGDPDGNVKPDPGRALDLMSRLAEYATPKLARTEVTGDPDNPLQTSLTVTFK